MNRALLLAYGMALFCAAIAVTDPVTWWRRRRWRRRVERVRLAPAAELLRGRAVRLGAYGDPAAVPFGVWQRLLEHVGSWTGYTHAWRTCDPRFREVLMASVDSHPQAIEAELAGWRYFRIRHPAAPVLSNELVCLNETRGTRCADCSFCDGARAAPNVVITVHGPRASRFGRAA